MTQYSNFFAETPPELLSPLTLLTRGTKNKHWNKAAQEVFKARGMTSSLNHMLEVERMLNSPETGRDSDWFWRYADDPPCGSWLNHDRPVGNCRDCKKVTARKFSGYWQCQTCAEQIKTAGGREALNLDKLAKTMKKSAEQQRIADNNAANAQEKAA